MKNGQIQKSKKDEFNSTPHENLYTTEFEAYLKIGSLHIQLKQEVAISTHTTNSWPTMVKSMISHWSIDFSSLVVGGWNLKLWFAF